MEGAMRLGDQGQRELLRSVRVRTFFVLQKNKVRAHQMQIIRRHTFDEHTHRSLRQPRTKPPQRLPQSQQQGRPADASLALGVSLEPQGDWERSVGRWCGSARAVCLGRSVWPRCLLCSTDRLPTCDSVSARVQRVESCVSAGHRKWFVYMG
jgi:hypothetical protein